MSLQVSDRRVGYTLNKSENATPELFAIYKPVKQMKVMDKVKGLRMLSRGNTWKSFKCDRGPIFQVTNLNRNPTQFRPSEIHWQPDPTKRKSSLRHVTTKNVF